jgi:dipeptidyl aminopeptidase/acylaminoacyl peptidase
MNIKGENMPDKLPHIPYGLWPSPISARMLGAETPLEDVLFDAAGQTLVWHEQRAGQGMLVAQSGLEAPRDLSGELPVRAGVGYGGGAFGPGRDLAVFVSQGRLFRVSLEYGQPVPITPAFGGLAAPSVSPDGRRVAFVSTYEDHDCLALVNMGGQNWPVKFAQGADFYMQPAWHPDSRQLAWIEWDYPNMPWDGTRLMLAEVGPTDESEKIQHLAGTNDIPIFQPIFSPNGRWLAYLAQEAEWDSLYLFDTNTGKTRKLIEGGALMRPAWVQGMRTMAWSASGKRIYYIRNDQGFASLWAVDVKSGATDKLDIAPYTWIEQLTASPTEDGKLAFIGSSPHIPARLVLWQDGLLRSVRRSQAESLSPEELPVPRPISWSAPDGMTVHGLYYPPTSTRARGEGLPPAMINIHGGPTSQRTAFYNQVAVYFASRGYAYLEVNYRGSTGYGRSYMLALRQNWGKTDVEDALGGAQALVDQSLADPKRLVIMGGSAGGYTVLNALIHHPGFFKAGINSYGVASLFDFIHGTHKFELHYNDLLVGTLPQDTQRLHDWSPVFHVDKIRDPLAVFQGADDKVVPPSHSESIVTALRANHVTHIYKVYAGEGHGWRKPETIEDYYNTIEKFLKEYVLFT